jgi:hypothetical protein
MQKVVATYATKPAGSNPKIFKEISDRRDPTAAPKQPMMQFSMVAPILTLVSLRATATITKRLAGPGT